MKLLVEVRRGCVSGYNTGGCDSVVGAGVGGLMEEEEEEEGRRVSYAHFTELTLSLKKKTRNNVTYEETIVRLFLFSSWPERGVPEVLTWLVMYGGGRWNGGRGRKGVCGCCGVTDVDAEG